MSNEDADDPAAGAEGRPDWLDDLPGGVVVADRAGRIVRANRVAASLLGRPAADLVGQDYRAALPLADAAGRDWWSCVLPYTGLAIRTSQPERLLTVAGGPMAGRPIYVGARFVRAADRSLARLVVTLQDAARRDRLERHRADLVSTVAHELRTPLTTIKGFTATLVAKWDRFTDEQRRQMLATVDADADRITRLVSELLDVSRIETGRLELRRQPADLAAIVEKAFADHVVAGEPAGRFVLERSGPLPEVWVDPDKMVQVVANLVDNAVRHGAGTVRVGLAPVPDGLRVTVRDEGAGIADDMLARVFTKFARGGRHGGSGLGLYLVRGIVQAHGGTVAAGRGPAGGAELRFTVPAGPPPRPVP